MSQTQVPTYNKYTMMSLNVCVVIIRATYKITFTNVIALSIVKKSRFFQVCVLINNYLPLKSQNDTHTEITGIVICFTFLLTILKTCDFKPPSILQDCFKNHLS